MFAKRTAWNLKKNRYTEALEHFHAGGRPLLDLTASNPTNIGVRYETERLLNSLSQPKALEYEPEAKGLPAAREAISAYYAQKGITVSPERLVLTVSTSEAYSYCFRLLCDPGDEVLVPQPSYPLFDFLAELQDVKLVPYELIYDHGWQIDFHSLECAISSRTRAVLVVHPNNPTGSFVKEEESKLLSRICSERELAIIADEVFLDYGMTDASPLSFCGNDSALTFTLSGLSKISGLPQMKVAWIALGGPEEISADAMARLEVIGDTYLSMNAPMQWALPELLSSRAGVQKQLCERVRSNLTELDRQIQGQTLCSRLDIEGGWYAIVRVPVTRSDEDLAIELLEKEGVLVQPGHFYDFATDGYLVVSLITPLDIFRQGVSRLFSFLHS